MDYQADTALEAAFSGKTFPTSIQPLIDQYCTGDWVISRALASFLVSAVVELGCHRILEFGAGTSSLLLATALAEGKGGQLTSVEQDPAWCRGQWEKVTALATVDAQMIVAQPQWTLGLMGIFFSFKAAREQIIRQGPYDLVLVDAPQYWLGREGVLPLVYRQLMPGAWIILDDAGRGGERLVLYQWLNTCPGLKLVHYDASFGGRGIAVLRYTGQAIVRPSVMELATNLRHAYLRWRSPEFRKPPA